jgi:hypothetical protein
MSSLAAASSRERPAVSRAHLRIYGFTLGMAQNIGLCEGRGLSVSGKGARGLAIPLNHAR